MVPLPSPKSLKPTKQTWPHDLESETPQLSKENNSARSECGLICRPLWGHQACDIACCPPSPPVLLPRAPEIMFSR